ncbi:MAG: hypothetical protein RLY86_4308 [Pseudomonadota bacterium]|jgi:hypothetical protein
MTKMPFLLSFPLKLWRRRYRVTSHLEGLPIERT